jgi:predicted Zn finger-like uncharacterized protein
MAIPIQCEKCGSRYRVADRMAGKRVRCKSCQATISVPDDTEVLEELPDEPPVAPAPRLGAAPPWFADPPPPPGLAQPGNPQQPGFSQAPGMPGMPFPNMGYGIPGYGQPGMGQPGIGLPGMSGLGYGQPGFPQPPSGAHPAAKKKRKRKARDESANGILLCRIAGVMLMLVGIANAIPILIRLHRLVTGIFAEPRIVELMIVRFFTSCAVITTLFLMIYGGFRCLERTSYPLAMAAAISCFFPLSFLFLISWTRPIPVLVGVATIIIINLPNVRREFGQ